MNLSRLVEMDCDNAVVLDAESMLGI